LRIVLSRKPPKFSTRREESLVEAVYQLSADDGSANARVFKTESVLVK
jgi:hypothetical protein